MYYIQPGHILNATEDLLEKFASLLLLHSLVLYNVVEQFTARCVLHDQVQLLWSLNYFVQLNHMRMLDNFENMDFP